MLNNNSQKKKMNGDEAKEEPCRVNGQLSAEELARIAREELNEKPEQRDQDLQRLREMLSNDPGLKIPTNDEFLLRFLRARKFDCERAYKLLKGYYKTRSEYPDIYENFYPSAIFPRAFENNYQMVLPEYDHKGRRLFVTQIGNWNPDHCSKEDIFRANQLSFEMATWDEQTQIAGMVIITDMKNFSWNHVKHFTPPHILQIVRLVQDCLPLRMKEFHVLNVSPFFKLMYAVTKPIVSKKLQSRIFLHGDDLSELHNHVTAAILPEEFGGEKGKMDNSSFVKQLLEKDEDFRNELKYGYLEKS